jgi:hypothetical protein
MDVRGRAATFAAVATVVVTGTTAYAVGQLQHSRDVRTAAPTVPSADPTSLPTGRFIAFRHTGLDAEYGVVAVVPLDDPDGPRAFTDAVCDRVAASGTGASCLTTERGVVTTYRSTQLDAEWRPEGAEPLAGLPSRTRTSPDGTLVATTSFITGHSYMTVGFSTATEIHASTGATYGNLEKFRLVADGRTSTPRDRNIWGVTFAADDRTFYATVATPTWSAATSRRGPSPRSPTASSARPCPPTAPASRSSSWAARALGRGGRPPSSTSPPASARSSTARPRASTTRSSGSTTTRSSTAGPAPTSRV